MSDAFWSFDFCCRGEAFAKVYSSGHRICQLENNLALVNALANASALLKIQDRTPALILSATISDRVANPA